MANLRAVEQGVGEWFDRKDESGDKQTDHGKPVRVKVHALTRDEERKARLAAYGNRQSSKLGGETFVKAAGRGEAYTLEAAVLSLEDTENFNVDLAGNARAEEMFGSFPRTKVKHPKAADSEVCFDGQWTEKVKRAYFGSFSFSRREAKAFADMSHDVGTVAVTEEEQATEDFSQP